VPIQAVESQRLYQQVAEQLGELIRRGEFRAGDRLPAERDLALQLGVSRPVVREAMIALEIARLIEVRIGSGIYVRKALDGAVQPLDLPDPGASPFDVIATRKLLEPEIAFAATGSLTAADLDAIAEALEQMSQAIAAGRDTKTADRLFHVRIAASTGNAVLVSLVDQLWENAFAPIFSGLSRRVGLPENQRAAAADHARIYKALQRRDGPRAREAMRAHLANVESIMMSKDSIT
jgi:DNA-binding FadR family transcriptional regulator